jgi:NhaC family Na+:H+ antiporter
MLSPWRFALIIFITVGGLGFAYFTDLPLFAGFSLGLLALIYFTVRAGFSGRAIVVSMVKGAGYTKEVVYILLFVGLMIPAWTASGTIPYMIEIGLAAFQPSLFLVSSFVFAAVISMTLGTSTGTLSSVGIPIIGVAGILGIPLPLAAGALISGAFVGDRGSPFSSAFQLVASSTGVTAQKQTRKMLPTTIGALLIALIFYAAMDVIGAWGKDTAFASEDVFRSQFHFSYLLLLPPVILVGAILLRFRTRYAFIAAIAASIGIGSILQNIPAADWVHYLWNGYRHVELPALSGKGVSHMIGLVVLIALAGAFNGILEDTKIIQPYIRKVLGCSGTLLGATWRTGLFGLGLALVSCTQTLPIMMSGRNMLPVWTERFPREQLARVVADTSLIFAAMVPWNMLAILCSTIIGVPVHHYVPYAVFLWALPLFTIVVSIFRDRLDRRALSSKSEAV